MANEKQALGWGLAGYLLLLYKPQIHPKTICRCW